MRRYGVDGSREPGCTSYENAAALNAEYNSFENMLALGLAVGAGDPLGLGDSSSLGGPAAEAGSGADNVVNGVRLRAQLIGEQISGGHAFADHVVKAGEFPGITTRQQFASRIEDVVTNGESRQLLRGRTAYWEGNTVVIRDPASVDGGTAFVPTGGYNYFLGLK